jgi:predicted nucleic acid-binding protein
MNAAEKIVVDASVVMAVVLNAPEKAGIIAATKGGILLSPGCLAWEVGNAFSAMLKRNRLTLADVQAGLEAYQSIPIEESGVDIRMAIRLCNKHRIYAYDAYYLELSLRGSLPLLTLDGRMAQIAVAEGIKIREIS